MVHAPRGYVLRSFDEPAALRPLEVPPPAAGQVLLDIRAASVNAFDWKVETGVLRHALAYDFPVTIGRDYAGVVRATGDSVTRVRPGDAVFGFLGGRTLHRGSFAEQLLLDENECFVPKPDAVSFETAACLPLSGTVALRLVDAVRPDGPDGKPGVVVVVGAPGGVGTIAVQLLAAAGAEVVATGRDDDEDLLRSLGATAVVGPGPGLHDRISVRHPTGVDGWIDVVHYRAQLAGFLDLLRPGGRVASLHGAVEPEDLAPLGLSGANITSAPDRALLTRLGELAAAGDVVVPIRRTFGLDDVAEALRTARETHTRGKSVVVMAPPDRG
jgi:NADPH2:quinone reductase